MRRNFHILLLSLVVFALSSPLAAQQGGGGGGNMTMGPNNGLNTPNPSDRIHKRWDIAGKVVTLQGDPVAGAKVQAETPSPRKRVSLTTNSDGSFHTSLQLVVEEFASLNLHVSAKKKGFLPAEVMVYCGPSDAGATVTLTLRPERQDDDSLSQDALISYLGPKLRALGPADGLSSKGERDYIQGASDFLDLHDSERAVESLAKVVKEDPACTKCRTMLALAELAAGDWDGAARDAGIAISKSSESNNGSPEAFLLSGVMQSWKDDPGGASNLLSQAVKRAPGDALALQELARAQIQNHEWASADANLSKAIDAGAGPAARLLHVQALLGEGEPDKANTELTAYLAKRDIKKMPAPVRRLWSSIQVQMRIKTDYASQTALAGRGDPEDYLKAKLPELQGLEDAKSQEKLEPILEATGKRVEQFFKGFQNTSSLEEIHEEKAGRNGVVHSSLDQKFHYICLTQSDPDVQPFNEYREDIGTGHAALRGRLEGFMFTAGFASASLVFHPVYQPQSVFRYLGRQEVAGKETYVVAFAQQPMKTTLSGAFTDGHSTVATYEKGLAWIDAQNYRIIRLRTDLLKPLETVGLQRETTEIDYQEVHFKNASAGLWLPRQVAVTVDWNGRILRNEHRYSDFKLFDVSTNQKIGNPKETEPPGKEDPGGKALP